MRILFTSDSHSLQNEIPKQWLKEADAICHSGDICLKGTHQEAVAFMKWFSELPYEHKLFTVGNHDICFDPTHRRYKYFKEDFDRVYPEKIDDIREIIPDNIMLLDNSGIEIEGLKFWGYPQTPEFCSWAFNIPRGEAMTEFTGQIPLDTDILLTHGPPRGILDMTMRGEYVGCEQLLERIKEVKPLVHSFGHIHEARGKVVDGDTLFLNSSVVNLNYFVVNQPHLVEIDEKKIVTLL